MSSSENFESRNIVWSASTINRSLRCERFSQVPCVVWFTGLSGAGKSTLAHALELALFEQGYSTYLLDGDNLRHGLNKDLGFSDKDRVENIRRVGEVAALMLDAGLIVLAAFISPFKHDRQMVRSLMQPGEFIEIYVSTPIATCEQRDSKGLYEKARSGLIRNFTGVDSEYEPPESPELTIDTSHGSIIEHVEQVLNLLFVRGVLRKSA